MRDLLKIDISQKVVDFLENGVAAMERQEHRIQDLEDLVCKQNELLHQLGDILKTHQGIWEKLAAAAVAASGAAQRVD